jgi:hypothetical protein
MTVIMAAMVVGVAGKAAANQGDPGGAAAAGGICMCVFGITALVVAVGMLIWYIQILVNTRNALASRMGRA